jgi:transposase-like protein
LNGPCLRMPSPVCSAGWSAPAAIFQASADTLTQDRSPCCEWSVPSTRTTTGGEARSGQPAFGAHGQNTTHSSARRSVTLCRPKRSPPVLAYTFVDRESLEQLLAQGLSLERIGRRLGKDPSTVAYWVRRHGLEAVGREKHSPKGGIERGRLEELVEAGMTIAEIAREVGRSKGTVRHWLRKYGLRTENSRGRRGGESRRNAKEAGFLIAKMTCKHHGETEFILEGRGYYRCKRCRAEGVARHRQKVKAILVKEAGGSCVICGYDRHPRALQFHHLDPSEKRLGLSSQGVTYSLHLLRTEARKCVLLCANCHAEVEHGVTSLPVQFSAGLDDLDPENHDPG